MTPTRTKDTRLKREARAAAKGRGHDMTPFRAVPSRRIYDAHCRTCRASMTVEPWPAPNGIEISGGAVALQCTGES